MKPFMLNACAVRRKGRAAPLAPYVCGLPFPLRGSGDRCGAVTDTPRHWQSHCTGARISDEARNFATARIPVQYEVL